MRYNTLGIHITNTCNMTCAHCITDSSPSARGDLPWEEIRAAIHSAAPHIDGVCVTGGEPFLRRDLTLQTIQLTRELGLVASLITNGFWSRSEAEAREVFTQLREAGLTKMGVSFDGYHDPIVTPETLDRLLTIGAEASIPIKVQYCGSADDDIYVAVADLAAQHGVELIVGGVLPFGRGYSLAVRRHPDIDKVPDVACGVAVRPVLTPEGDLYTCCGPARGASPDSPLRLAAPTPSDTGQALREAASDPLLNLIHTQGPRALYERLGPNTQKRVAANLLDESFCSLCRAITDDAEAVAELRGVLADERFTLMAASAFMQVRAAQKAVD